jgi:hypothetical protein
MEKALLIAPGRPALAFSPDLQSLWEPVEKVLARVTAPMASPSHALVSLVLVSSSDRLARPPLLATATGGGEQAKLE